MTTSRIIYIFAIVLAATPLSTEKYPKGKIEPEHKGVDKEIQSIVNDYKRLASLRGIHFKKEITIGFKEIESDSIVGLCHYGNNFREIDLDKTYWKRSSEDTKITLLFHELTHCYCYRDHDWKEGEIYISPQIMELVGKIFTKPFRKKPEPGFYDDDCPLSIMYPSVVSDECVLDHSTEYIKEMFDRCEPY